MEIGNPEPWGPQLSISALSEGGLRVSTASQQGQPLSSPLTLSSSRSVCPLLPHKVIGLRPAWVLSPHLLPTLLSDLPLCYLTSFFSPLWQHDLLWYNLWSLWAISAHFLLSSLSALFRSNLPLVANELMNINDSENNYFSSSFSPPTPPKKGKINFSDIKKRCKK